MILKAKEISKSYSGRKVVDNISIQVNQGEIVGLLGPNGAGKTTSFYMIVGIIKPEDGDIYLDNEIISIIQCIKGLKEELDTWHRRICFQKTLC